MSSPADVGNLQVVLIGTIENYVPYVWGWKSDGLRAEDFAAAVRVAKGSIPKKIIEEIGEDLNDFADALSSLGIKTLKMKGIEPNLSFENDFFFAAGNDQYNVRDLHLIVGNKLIFAAPPCPARLIQNDITRDLFLEIANDYNLDVIDPPRPEFRSNPLEELDLEINQIKNETFAGKILGGSYGEKWHKLCESEILFDAANVARFSKFGMYLISSTGNIRAAKWLSQVLGGEYTLLSTDVYKSSHIDSTIIPLSPNTVLVNSKRVSTPLAIKELEDYEIIEFSDVSNIPPEEIEFNALRMRFAEEIHQLGFETNLSEMSSPWAGMNVLVVKEGLIAVESRQVSLMRLLESRGFEVLPVKYRHPYTMLGGLHCSTLDIVRV